MHKNVYLTELIPDESPPELVEIHTGIRLKLISKGIPVTRNVDEAHFMIVFFTRGFIRRHLEILSVLGKLSLGYSVVFWDKKQYPPRAPTLGVLLRLGESFDDQLAEELQGCVPDGTPEFQLKLRDSLRYMNRHSQLNTTVLHNRYIPSDLTDANSLVNQQVETIEKWINPFSIDYSKLAPVESDLDKIAGFVDINNGDTRFLVISGSSQTHDMTTIIKGLSMTYLLSFPPFYNSICYIDNLQQYRPHPPHTLAHGLLAHCLGLELTDKDFNKTFTDWNEDKCYRSFKNLLILDGISSFDELKEVRKFGHLCNQIDHDSMVILSTGLDIIREWRSYFESHNSVFLGYIEGGALAGQSASMYNPAEECKPFCLMLNDVQLGRVLETVESEGDMPKDPSSSEPMFLDEANETGLTAKEPLRRRNEEVVGDPKRLKIT